MYPTVSAIRLSNFAALTRDYPDPAFPAGEALHTIPETGQSACRRVQNPAERAYSRGERSSALADLAISFGERAKSLREAISLLREQFTTLRDLSNLVGKHLRSLWDDTSSSGKQTSVLADLTSWHAYLPRCTGTRSTHPGSSAISSRSSSNSSVSTLFCSGSATGCSHEASSHSAVSPDRLRLRLEPCFLETGSSRSSVKRGGQSSVN